MPLSTWAMYWDTMVSQDSVWFPALLNHGRRLNICYCCSRLEFSCNQYHNISTNVLFPRYQHAFCAYQKSMFHYVWTIWFGGWGIYVAPQCFTYIVVCCDTFYLYQQIAALVIWILYLHHSDSDNISINCSALLSVIQRKKTTDCKLYAT